MVDQAQRSEDAGAWVDPERLFIALKRRRWIITGAAILGTVAGAATAKGIVEPVFEARSVIECDRCTRADLGDRELATLQESVKLPQHIEDARQKLGIVATLESIDRDVEVGASIESRLIHVTARGKNGELAAGLANVIVAAFMETRLQVERDKLEKRATSLTIDAQKARASIMDARGRYDRFRGENNIADLPAERQAAIQEAARLRSELATARAEELAEQARREALLRVSEKESSTAILDVTMEFPDAKHLATKKAQLAAARARLSADHPSVQALTSEVEALEQGQAAVNNAITTGRTVGRNPQWESAQQSILEATANQEAASARQSMLEKLAHSTAQAVARLSNIEGEASALLSNLQSAEQHASAIDVDLKHAQNAARTPSTGLRILAMARAPSTPVKSTRRIVALLGPLLGFLVAVIVVVLRELRGLRVHTAAELAFWGKGPVLTASQWPNRPGTLADIVTELIGPLQKSSGKTLVLGVSPLEIAHVHALAYALHEELERQGAARNQGSFDVLGWFTSSAELRRAVRQADRVLVVVASGRHSAFALRAFVAKAACPTRIGFILLGLHDEHVSLPDVAGDADAFWNAGRFTSKRSIRRANGMQTKVMS